jgi:hypothetical protein
MKNLEILKAASALALAAMMATACAKAPVKKEEPVKAAVPTPEAKASYVVKKGDSLWKIAGKSAVMGDPFRWPLLFKANRDQIEDPDLIEVKLDLGYKKDYSQDEINDAVGKAKETPPYVPHDAPRKSLPVKY